MEQNRKVNGVETHWTDTVEGTGNPVVLLHGWGCDHTTLASLGAVAETSGRRVISMDLPGFGHSAEPEEVWSVEEYADWLEAFLDTELPGTQPVLLGHSFGGQIAALTASRRPVEKLVLVDAACIRRHNLKWYIKVYSYKARRRLMQLLLGKEKAAARIEEARRKAGSVDYVNSSPKMRAVMARVTNRDLSRELPNIKCPTLLIWGELDTATTLKHAKVIEKLVPDAGLVAIPGAGHFSFLDNPAIARSALASFLNS